MSTVQFRTDEAVKVQAAQIFGQLGITMSDAINIFLRQSIMHGGLPFEVKIPNAPKCIMVVSKEDLHEKLGVGMEQIKNGKVIGSDEVMTRLKDKYGFQN